MTWSEKPSGEYIFWLNGMAGTGKSTIARTIAEKFADQKRLGASFFFSRGKSDLESADKLFPTIACQLADLLPALKPYLCEAIGECSDIAQRSLSEQWKKLVLQPLSILGQNSPLPSTLILVIDALDECEDEDIKRILPLLAEVKSLETIHLRVFITSRPETTIRHKFSNISGDVHKDFILQDISQSIVEHDISVFIKDEMDHIKKYHDHLSEGWPGEKIIDLLVQRAGSLFIHAATVCRFIGDQDWDPKDRLSSLLKSETSTKSYMENLDETYRNILMHSVLRGRSQQGKIELCDRFKHIVRPIAILFDPLSTAALAELLSVELSTVNITLRPLHSVLDVSEKSHSPIRLLHLSFPDFLLDRERCQEQFWIEEDKTHGHMAKCCIQLMSSALKRDICGLQLGTLISEVESQRVKENLPPDVQYACRYWVQHLQQGNMDLHDNGIVHVFFLKHFLHWLEALSLIQNSTDGVIMLRMLESILTVSDPVQPRDNPAS
jgi:hypothetical protein